MMCKIDKFKKIIKKNDMQNIVQYVRWVTGVEKKELFLNSDIMLLPSYSEGLPISLLEGVSYSMPLVSTHVGGIPDIINKSFLGIISKSVEVKDLKEAVKTFLLSDRARFNNQKIFRVF